jgi:hypothetical protein
MIGCGLGPVLVWLIMCAWAAAAPSRSGFTIRQFCVNVGRCCPRPPPIGRCERGMLARLLWRGARRHDWKSAPGGPHDEDHRGWSCRAILPERSRRPDRYASFSTWSSNWRQAMSSCNTLSRRAASSRRALAPTPGIAPASKAPTIPSSSLSSRRKSMPSVPS